MATRSSWAKLIVSGRSAEQPSPASPKASTPATEPPSGRAAMATNAAASTNGSSRYTRVAGEAALDGGEQDPPDGHHPPERGEGDGGDSRRGSYLGGHVELRPVAVERLADAVQHGERGVQGEPARDRAPAAAVAVGAAAGVQRQWSAGEQEAGEQDRRQHGQAPPEPEADEDRHEDRRQRGAGPRRALSTRTDRSTAAGWNAAVNVLRVGTVSPNPTPRQAVATSSSA